jgi:hypothetical protein
MRRSLVQFSGPGASNRSSSWADSITTTPGFEFSVHTPDLPAFFQRLGVAVDPSKSLHGKSGLSTLPAKMIVLILIGFFFGKRASAQPITHVPKL